MCETLGRIESMLCLVGYCGCVRGRRGKRQGILGVRDVGWGCKSYVSASL